ncbi:MAG: sulfite exporter TauE/SafE family protein [Actinomycetota bacterium]
MSPTDAVLLVVGGLFAGVINAMAGGGSLLTVPLLSLAGVEGLLANGTNRVGVLIQTGSAGIGFARRGVGGREETLRILVPTVVGGVIGSVAVSQIDDELFERAFGVLMIPLLVLALWKPRADRPRRPWPYWLTATVFVGVGFYAGAIQAGVGLILLLVLSRAGHDLVTANAIKTYVVIAVSIVAVAVFVSQDQVRWLPALVLSAGTAAGGYLGSQIAVDGGERVIKPVLVVSVLALSGRMIGLY